MKILWLSHLVPYPPKGGVLQRAYHLLRKTAEKHDVHLIALAQKDLFAIHFTDTRTALTECAAALSFCKSLSFHDIPTDNVPAGRVALAARSLVSRHPYSINWLASKPFSAALRDFVRSESVDLVHLDTIGLVPYAAATPHVPMTLDHHNVESQMLLRRAANEANVPKKLYFLQEGYRLQRYEHRVCGSFGSNLMCSDLDAERLKQICPDAVTDVIPNGIDLDYFAPHRGLSEPRRFIFAGRLNSYPNAEAVRFMTTELWPRLKAAIPGVSLDIVGANPPREALSLAQRDSAFRVLGFVDDVRPCLDAAGIYLCPMFDGGGTRLKVLDAMAMEKPIIATRLAVEGIDVAHNKEVYLAETAEDFVQGAIRLLDDPGLAANLAAAARQKAIQKYSYESIGRTLIDTFERVRERGPAFPTGRGPLDSGPESCGDQSQPRSR